LLDYQVKPFEEFELKATDINNSRRGSEKIANDSKNGEVDDDSYFNFNGNNVYQTDRSSDHCYYRRHNSEVNDFFDRRSSFSNAIKVSANNRFAHLEKIANKRSKNL